MQFDHAVLALLAAHRTDWANDATRGLMDAGMSPLAYVAAFLLCLVFGQAFHAWRAAAAALVGAFVSILLADVGKDLIGRPRPQADLALVVANGYAMPSSIAAMTLGAAMPLILFGFRRATRPGRLLAAALVAVTVVIGISMIYLGAHWVTDVLAGWLLGGAVGAATLAVFTRWGSVRARAGR